jgi:hypothetical protein
MAQQLKEEEQLQVQRVSTPVEDDGMSWPSK